MTCIKSLKSFHKKPLTFQRHFRNFCWNFYKLCLCHSWSQHSKWFISFLNIYFSKFNDCLNILNTLNCESSRFLHDIIFLIFFLKIPFLWCFLLTFSSNKKWLVQKLKHFQFFGRCLFLLFFSIFRVFSSDDKKCSSSVPVCYTP